MSDGAGPDGGAPPADVLARFSAATGIDVFRALRLRGGELNLSFRLWTTAGDLVLRFSPPREAELQVDRHSECAILARASAAGLAPAVLWCAPESRVLVTRYVPPGVWTRDEARSAAGIASMGHWLARLHRLAPPRGCRVVDYVRVLPGYVATLAARGASGPDVAPFLEVLRAAPAPAPRPAVLCHNDVHHLNILGTIDTPRVIDWEYAGAGDARLDLAQYALAHGLDVDACARLLAAYGAGGPAVPATDLRAAMDLAAAVNAAWAAVARTGESGGR